MLISKIFKILFFIDYNVISIRQYMIRLIPYHVLLFPSLAALKVKKNNRGKDLYAPGAMAPGAYKSFCAIYTKPFPHT